MDRLTHIGMQRLVNNRAEKQNIIQKGAVPSKTQSNVHVMILPFNNYREKNSSGICLSAKHCIGKLKKGGPTPYNNNNNNNNNKTCYLERAF